MGVTTIVDLLLSYFMEMLTFEHIKLEDKYTPGIPATKGFDTFGKKF